MFVSGPTGEAPDPTGEAVENAAKAGAGAAAARATKLELERHLVMPLKSSTFRVFSYLAEGLEFAGEVTPIGFAARDVFPAEYKSAKANVTGQCQNNWASQIPSW